MEFAKCVCCSCIIFQMRRSTLPGIKLLHTQSNIPVSTFFLLLNSVDSPTFQFYGYCCCSFIKDYILLLNSERKQYVVMQHLTILQTKLAFKMT